MNKIKRLLLASAIFGGIAVGNAVTSFGALPPLPVNYFNYAGSGRGIVLANGESSSMISGDTKIRVSLMQNASSRLGDPQIFTYYTDEDYVALPAAQIPTTKRFSVNKYGILSFNFDVGTVAPTLTLAGITSSHFLKLEREVNNNWVTSGSLYLKTLLQHYYESGNTNRIIADAKAESLLQADGIIDAITPLDGSLQVAKSGKYIELKKGTNGQILNVKSDGTIAWSSLSLLPETTSSDEGKTLAVQSNGSLAWESLAALPG